MESTKTNSTPKKWRRIENVVITIATHTLILVCIHRWGRELRVAGDGAAIGAPRERSPRTPLPPPAPVPILTPMHPPPRTPMTDAYRYRNLFPRRRVAPPTLPPSDDEPSDKGDSDDPEDSQTASDTSLSSRDVSSAGASHGSEQESTSFSSGPADRFSSGSSSGGSSVGSLLCWQVPFFYALVIYFLL
ncbi:hypothetical protein PIB30_023304 [Stylosanthes scabra]|uniref:Uncharacterized protein n=1 Tax=Stylosanthes scabra TaxID=79078 RepID=A0ABU6RA02_9FABA|nr:hypothetical protein [Stylosanthes scabra]